jgi:hypothetical protein
MPDRKPQPNSQTYGLEALHVFPYFQTREAFRMATGQEPPPYNDKLRPKYWRDVDALLADPDEPITYDVAYNARGGVFTNPGTDQPRLGKMSLMPAEAGSVNIPPKGVGVFPGGASNIEVQPPMHDLQPNERLVFQPGIASAQLMIRRTDLTPTTPPALGNGFTDADRALLRAIGQRIGAI